MSERPDGLMDCHTYDRLEYRRYRKEGMTREEARAMIERRVGYTHSIYEIQEESDMDEHLRHFKG